MKFLKEINLVSIAGDPASPVNGDIWYDSSLSKLRGYENGASHNLINLGYYGTSTTSLTVNAGTQTFYTQEDLAYRIGQIARISYDSSNYMEGNITFYTGQEMRINVTYKNGSGTYASWIISPSTEQRIPTGGGTDYVLAKNSSTDYDVSWKTLTASPNNSDYNNSFLLMGS